MPWREICPMEEKTRFIAAVLEGEENMMAAPCAEFGSAAGPVASG